jgi:hypothetical protein
MSRRVALAFVVAMLAGVASLSAQGASASTGRRVTPARSSVAASSSSAPVADPFTTLSNDLNSSYPDSFSGLYISTSGQLTVSEVGTNSALEASADALWTSLSASAVSGNSIAFSSTGRFTLNQLTHLKDEIFGDSAARAAGVFGAGLDLRNNLVVVNAASSQAGQSWLQSYPQSAISFVIGPPPMLTTKTRYTDTHPWSGGDQIVSSPYTGNGCQVGYTCWAACTSGFPIYDTVTGNDYLLTAGHCSANGPGSTTWYNLNSNNGPPYTENSTDEVGSTDFYTTTNIDSQFFGARYGATCTVWGGQSTSGSNDVSIYPTGYADPVSGATILQEGSFSFEETGTVSAVNVSMTFAGENLENLFETTGAYPVEGDSGGPVIEESIYGDLATGTIVGQLLYYNNGHRAYYGVDQNIDAILYTDSLDLGHEVLPITSSNGLSC